MITYIIYNWTKIDIVDIGEKTIWWKNMQWKWAKYVYKVYEKGGRLHWYSYVWIRGKAVISF